MDPELQLGDLDFKEVLILALVPNNNHKIIIENEVAKRMINTIGVPAHKVLEKEDLKELESKREKLVNRGFDGALVIRLLDEQERSFYIPGEFPAYYYQFTDYYGYSYSYIFDPGARIEYEKEVNLEINIYSLKNDKIVWSGHTTTYVPDDIKLLVGPYMQSLAEELTREGLINMDHSF